MNSYFVNSAIFNIASIALCIITRLFYLDESFIFIEIVTAIAGILSGLIVLNYPSTRFNFFLVSAPVILLGTSVGLLNTYFTVEYFQEIDWLNVLIDNNITTENLIDGQSYTNAFCLILSCIGIKLQNSGRIDALYDTSKDALESDDITNWFVLIIFLCQLYLILTDEVVFGGVTSEKQGKASHPLQAVVPLFAVLPIWSAYKLKSFLTEKSPFVRFLLPVSVAFINIYWPFLLGRRMIFFFIILFISGFYFDKSLKVKLVSINTLILCLSFIAAIQLSNLYNKFRLIKGYSFVQQNGLQKTLTSLSDDDVSDFSKGNLANVSIRSSYNTMTFAYFINLTNKLKQPLYGTILYNQFLVTTPGDFFVDKTAVLTKEKLYMDVFSITLTDISDTMYLEALVDYGLLGILIYPLFLLFILIPVYFFSSINNRSSLFIGSSCYFMALSMIETDINVFFTMIRIFLVVFVISYVVKLIANR